MVSSAVTTPIVSTVRIVVSTPVTRVGLSTVRDTVAAVGTDFEAAGTSLLESTRTDASVMVAMTRLMQAQADAMAVVQHLPSLPPLHW